MKVKVLPKKIQGHKELYREAASLDDAYEKGYFSGNISEDEFKRRILKKNPQLKFIRNRHHAGIWDYTTFITGYSPVGIVPLFTIGKLDPSKTKSIQYTNEHGEKTHKQEVNQDEEQGKILIRSYISVFNELRRKGYEITDDLY